MLTIYKYELPSEDNVWIDLPEGAKVLSAQVQQGSPCLWALVSPDAPLVNRHFRISGTGHPIHEHPANLHFIDTFQIMGGDLIFHLFEVIK